MANEWGPLSALAGEWTGEGGLDVSFSHDRGAVHNTPYLEKVTMKPFGPVDNSSQHLYGLDYKTAMWRESEENPFHTEVGYWLWDSATDENKNLAAKASSISYEVTVTLNDETTMLVMSEFAEPLAHTDRNTMHRLS